MIQKFTIGKLVPRCCNRNGKVMTAERKGGDQSRPSKILLVYSDLKVNSKSSHFLKAFGLITRHPWLKGPLSATPLLCLHAKNVAIIFCVERVETKGITVKLLTVIKQT